MRRQFVVLVVGGALLLMGAGVVVWGGAQGWFTPLGKANRR